MLPVQDLGQRAGSGELLNIAGSCSKKNSVYAHPEPASRVRPTSLACVQTSGTLGGRLSTTYQPRSSSVLAAVDRPAPDMPVTTTSPSLVADGSTSPGSVAETIIPCSASEAVELDRGDFPGCGVDSFALRQSLQRLFDTEGGLGAEARDGGDLLNRGGAKFLQRTEVVEQQLSADLAQAGHLIQDRLDHRLTAPFAVMGDGETVSLVAQSLEKIKSSLVRGRMTGSSLSGNHTSSRRFANPRSATSEIPSSSSALAAAATWGGPPSTTTRAGRTRTFAERRSSDRSTEALPHYPLRARHRGRAIGGRQEAAEPAGDDFVHRRDIVLAVDVPDDEPAVLTLAGQSVLEDHH